MVAAGPYGVTAYPVSWLPYESPAADDRQINSEDRRSDAPICQDTRSGGLDDLLASAEIGHDTLVDLASEETFQAPDDLSLGSAVRTFRARRSENLRMPHHAAQRRKVSLTTGPQWTGLV